MRPTFSDFTSFGRGVQH
ncbi:hypothetical protein Pint_34319 [Pistacia integerrima]|uniref:Uncharacterized protein n=1 Tax=Pistacia integerrima TaxID=434235 RepID=A0ACC0X690_9ROSI|nr:hypothetical protein Pint_34319 [Pistacia integerrima]KAJ0077714.1 hypothetical protein Patl1_35449 [Pistacia atlantica]